MPVSDEVYLTLMNERKRCCDIITMARMGEVDTDLRAIISMIQSGVSIEKLKAEAAR